MCLNRQDESHPLEKRGRERDRESVSMINGINLTLKTVG